MVTEDGDVSTPTNPCVDCVCETICVPANVDPDGPVCKKAANADPATSIEHVVDTKIVAVHLFVLSANIPGERTVKNDKI